jgi:hypothetical protein
MCANDDHTFCPLTTNSPPASPSTGSARVRTPARSLPAPGSEKPWQKICSPDRIACRCLAFCFSVPWAMIVGPAMPNPITPTWSGAPALAISSSRIAWNVYGAPPPPYSLGQVSPA